mgnify:CR=1 FL=1
MAIGSRRVESSSSRAINCNAYHQTDGVGRDGFGARQYIPNALKKNNINRNQMQIWGQI